MHIDQVRDEAMRWARQRKESTVAEAHDDDRPDISPWLTGWRGDHPVISMMPVGGAREIVLRAGRIMALAFGCDVIVITHEAWKAVATSEDELINPITGQPWQSGEMEDVVMNHQGLEKGWITEMINVMVVNKAGDLSTGAISFTQTKTVSALGIPSWSIEWGEELRLDSESTPGHIQGVIPESLIEYMNEPDFMSTVLQDPMGADLAVGFTPEETRAHADAAIVKHLPRMGYEGAAMLMSDNAERAAVLNDSLKGNPMLYDMWSVEGGWTEDGDY